MQNKLKELKKNYEERQKESKIEIDKLYNALGNKMPTEQREYFHSRINEEYCYISIINDFIKDINMLIEES